ncbi:MarR family transcriptional regulator [Aquabacter sp. CN5-332]|uniref:MarR family winged helix-turn-helix transcriptional regulator n=1 Tax=Aquabacter sp. CN5-332 TaxID=3156608 RepID=UPI0032B49865
MADSQPAAPRRKGGKEEGLDYAALAEFRYAIRKFLAFSEEAATQAGLTSQQHQALLTIKGVGAGAGISVGVLAQRLLIRQHTAVELVDRLERSDLVRRMPDAQDKRRVLVTLTGEGEKRLKQLSAVHLDELRAIGPTLADILATLQPAQS